MKFKLLNSDMNTQQRNVFTALSTKPIYKSLQGCWEAAFHGYKTLPKIKVPTKTFICSVLV